MSDFDITKVKKLTRESIMNSEQSKVTLEGLKKMCCFLDEQNPATYEIFLKHRPDLGETEVAYYKDIIETLKENARLKQEFVTQHFKSYQESLIVPPPTVIYDSKINHIHNPC